MKRIVITLVILGSFLTNCNSQTAFGTNGLVLEKTIAMPGVKGRIDHMDVNVKDQVVYIAALGNNSLEIVSLANGAVVHSIKGLDEPQGVAYIPQHQEIIVANGSNGACNFYNANSFKKIASVKLSSDADDVRYDSTAKKIYIGYGDGGIAIIDADSHQQIGDIKLPGHPEGFQIDKEINRLFVNVPGAGITGVVDLQQQRLIGQWKNVGNANFPMAIDTASHTVFIGYRSPAEFVAINGQTGERLSTNAMVSDADDLYYDEGSKELFVSGGGGSVNIFRIEKKDYKKLANIPVRSGARTSLLVPQLHLFLLAERATTNKAAELVVYRKSDL